MAELDMVMVYKSGLMELDTKESGLITKPKAKESLFTLMETSIKANGKRIKLLVMESTFTIMEQDIKANG